MSSRNTSQDPDYVGPTGHEKRVHKTHFSILRTLKKSNKAKWIKIAPGRYKLVRKHGADCAG